LLQASLGMCAKTGDIAEIVRGIVYNGYPYSDERKKRNKEHLGEMLFYWIMLASTTGANPEEIISEYISSYIQKHKIVRDDDLKMLMRDKLAQDQNTKVTLDLSSNKTAVNNANNSTISQKAQASIMEMLKYIKENEPRAKTTSKEANKEIEKKDEIKESIENKTVLKETKKEELQLSALAEHIGRRSK